MTNSVLNAICCGGMLLLLGACNVGSDGGQQTTVAASSQSVVTQSPKLQAARPGLATSINTRVDTTEPTRSETYYLLLHGLDATGEPVTNSYAFQKNVRIQGNHSVQLIWFEPNRTADGSCLPELSGYELEYGQQPDVYNTKLRFDLASRDMACTTVGTTECGDVRECRYKLTL